MTSRKHIVFILISLTILISGCSYSQSYDIAVAEWNITEIDGQHRFNGTVAPAGNPPEEFTVNGVVVEFRDENRTVITTYRIGTIDEERFYSVESVMEMKPAYIFIKYEEESSNPEAAFSTTGLHCADQCQTFLNYTATRTAH